VQANLNQDYFQNGQKTGSYTEEINGGTATVDVSKLGTNQLKIGDSIDFIYTVEGNRLTAEPESSDESYADGLREIIVTQSSGQLGAGKITGQDTFTGTWSYSGQTGTTTGVLNWTLTKR
jgi:hypothetical protein